MISKLSATALFLSFVFLCSDTGNSIAAPSSAQLEQVQIQAEKSAKDAKELAKNKKKHDKALRKIKKQLSNLTDKIRSAEKEIQLKQTQLDHLIEKENHFKAQLATDQRRITDLLKKYQELKKIPKMAMLSPAVSPRSLIYQDAMIRHTTPILHQQMADAQNRIKVIQNFESQIIEQQAELRDQLDSLMGKSKKIAKWQSKEKKLLSQATKQYQQKHKMALSQAAKAKDLQDLIAKVTPTILPQKKPKQLRPATIKLPHSDIKITKSQHTQKSIMPVVGKINVRFGQKDLIGAKSQGLTFSTHQGAFVYAPMSGTVRFSGAFNDYKTLVIIDHGNGYHSLVAGLDIIDVQVGKNIASGEIIGKFNTETSQPKLYYELRQNGKPVNPEPVLHRMAKNNR